MENQYNMRSPAVKRLMREAQELREPTEEYYAQPVEDNLFEWHFTVRGPPDSDFEGGVYHGRIVLPPEYPMKPPSIILLTPNGRFEVNKKICLSISGHHPESWQPSWSIRTALLALIGFMPTHGNGAIGSLDYTPEERRQLAKKSQTWTCRVCGVVGQMLRTSSSDTVPSSATQEERELASQICFKGEVEKNNGGSAQSSAGSANTSSANGRLIGSLEPETGVEQNASSVQQESNQERTPSSTDVRRRVVAGSAPVAAAASSEGTADSRTASSAWSTVLIVVLSLAILGLLIRRIFFL